MSVLASVVMTAPFAADVVPVLMRLNTDDDHDLLPAYLETLGPERAFADCGDAVDWMPRELNADVEGCDFRRPLSTLAVGALHAMMNNRPLAVAAYADFITAHKHQFGGHLGAAMAIFTREWCDTAAITVEDYIRLARATTTIVEDRPRHRFYYFPAYAEGASMEEIIYHLLDARAVTALAGVLGLVCQPDVARQATAPLTQTLVLVFQMVRPHLTVEQVKELFASDDLCMVLDPYFERLFATWEGMEEQSEALRQSMTRARANLWEASHEARRDRAGRWMRGVRMESMRAKLSAEK